MLLRAGVALVLLVGVARADPAPARGPAAHTMACVSALNAARDWAARLDSALEKLNAHVDGRNVLMRGGECNRVDVAVRVDARGQADHPWRAGAPSGSARVGKKRVSLLLDGGGANLCGEEHVEERAHGGFVASLVTRAVPVAIVERFKRAVDECVNAGAGPKSARRPDRRAAPP
jgi:hypothetical protein